MSPRVHGPRLSAPLAADIRAAVRAAKAARGMSWPRVAAAVGVPHATLKTWMGTEVTSLRLEWAVRLAAWCGLELTLAPSRAPAGVGEFGDPDGDEGEA